MLFPAFCATEGGRGLKGDAMQLMLSSNRVLLKVLAAAVTAVVCATFVAVALAGTLLTGDHRLI